MDRLARLAIRAADKDLPTALSAVLFDDHGDALPAGRGHAAVKPLSQALRSTQADLLVIDGTLDNSDLIRAQRGYKVRAGLAMFSRRYRTDRPQAWERLWRRAFGAVATINLLQSYAELLGFDAWDGGPDAYPNAEARATWVAMRVGSTLLKIARHGTATRRGYLGRRFHTKIRPKPNEALYRYVGGHVLSKLDDNLYAAYGLGLEGLTTRLLASTEGGLDAARAGLLSSLSCFEKRPVACP